MVNMRDITASTDGTFDGEDKVILRPKQKWRGTAKPPETTAFLIIEKYREFIPASFGHRGQYNSKEKTWKDQTDKEVVNSSAHGQNVTVQLISVTTDKGEEYPRTKEEADAEALIYWVLVACGILASAVICFMIYKHYNKETVVVQAVEPSLQPL